MVPVPLPCGLPVRDSSGSVLWILCRGCRSGFCPPCGQAAIVAVLDSCGVWSSDSFSLPSAFVAFLIGREKGRGFPDAFQRSPVYGRSSLPWVFPVKDSNGSGLRIFCRVPGLDPVRVLVRPLWFLVWMPRPLPLRLSDRTGEGQRLPAACPDSFRWFCFMSGFLCRYGFQ